MKKTEADTKLHNQDMHDLCSPPNIIKLTKSKKMSWTRPLVWTGDKRNACRILIGEPENTNQFEALRVGGRIILKLELKIT
jgi:hypothetical protein